MENRIVCKVMTKSVPGKGYFKNVDNTEGKENYRQARVQRGGEMQAIHAKLGLRNFESIRSIAAKQLTPVRRARWIHHQ